MSPRWRPLVGMLVASALASCGAATPAPPKPTGKRGAPASALVTVGPAELVPELDAAHLAAWFTEPGVQKYLLSGLRILVHDDGRVERATDRFPSGGIEAIVLPERLGGGYLFYQSDSHGTRMWKAAGWTALLQPLAHVGPTSQEVIAGFDRIYLRTRTNQVLAIDVDTGEPMAEGPLPAAPRLGRMVFADGWRAIVDTDLRGPLATFDAGVSWRPLGIVDPIHSVGVVGGDPVIYVPSGSYRLDAEGHIQFVGNEPAENANDDEDDRPVAPVEHPLGDHPLRTALTRGWPDSKNTGVVVHAGKLIRVALPSATVLAERSTNISEQATCQGGLVGSGFGFICGQEDGPTHIYRFVPPLGLTPFASFETPRFVSPSGNGSLVVRGACEGDGADGGELRTYCVLDAAGTRHEVAVRGEIGAERVVALKDGRVVVLVPPRFGRPGRLTIIDGEKVKGVELRYPDEPVRAVKVARRGLWLEGFEQRSKDTIGGWVEAGGPAVGVTVHLDGKVVPGKVYDEGGQLLVAGRLAVATSDAETGLESTDGGESWREFELPRLPESPDDPRTRGCSPLGCALRGWLRVGWGKTRAKDDLRSVPPPRTVTVQTKIRPTMDVDCHLAQIPPAPLASTSVGPQAPYSSWQPFRDVPPPKLAKDDLGVDKASQSYADLGIHVYVWGAKGADWSRTGWWKMRFEDPFAPAGAVRSSADSRPPWSDEVTAAEAIGARHYGSYWRWEASLDPAGDAALVYLCNGSRCDYYAVSDGRPILEIKVGALGYGNRRPLPHGVARVGEAWYMLSETHHGGPLSLWRASLGVMTEVASFRRLTDSTFLGNVVAPQLVRSAIGADIGILFQEPPDAGSGDTVGQLVVLPFNPVDQTLGSPIPLGPADVGAKLPPLCEPHDEGWVLDMSPPSSPDVDLRGARSYVDDVRLRVRLAPGRACVDGISARAGRTLDDASPVAPPASATVPMAVTERYTGRRWSFLCGNR